MQLSGYDGCTGYGLSLLRHCLLLMLMTSATALPAEDGETADGVAASREAIYQRLNSAGIYERRKALEELLSVAPGEPGTVAALIRLFRSPDADEARYAELLQRVERALQDSASKTTWSSGNVELLTSVLAHNDAHDSRATSRTASTVAAVARYQTFSRRAIDDLITVLWQRVDRNPNRTRNDNTRAYVVQALRHIQARQGLPRTVIEAGVTTLGSERNAGVRRETVLLLAAYARGQPADEAVLQALTGTLFSDDKATVRALAARALRGLGEQRDYPRSLVITLGQAAGDPDPAVRHEAMAGLMAAAAEHSSSPEMLPPETGEQLLQAAVGDPDARVRLQAVQALGTLHATRVPDPAVPEALFDRLGKENDGKVRGQLAITLEAIHIRRGSGPAVMEPLIPLVTDDPEEEVRRALGRLFVEQRVERGLAAWMQATAAMGLSPAGAAAKVTVPDIAQQSRRAEQSALQARLREQYVSALAEGRDRAVRAEILQGLFTLALTDPLPQPALEVLGRRLVADADAGLRLQAAAVLLHHGLQYHRDSGPFYPALADDDARVHDYAAYALVELNAVDGDVLPGLLAFARDSSVHRNLRLYSLRRLALRHGIERNLPDSVQAVLQELTGDPDAELRAEAWNALRQFDAAGVDWRRAAADDDPAIRRMAWRELEAQGVDKPVRAKWRDPKQRLELIAVGLLGTTLLAIAVGAVLFSWRLLCWWQGTRQQRGRLFAAQGLWLVATLLTVALDAGLVFIVAVSHVGLSIKDLMQLNTVFGVILASYAAVTYLGWKLLPARTPGSA